MREREVRGGLDVAKFKAWLVEYGCEVLPNRNQYEAVRFYGAETGIVYTSGKTSSSYASYAIKCFREHKKWNGGIISTGRKNTYVKEKKVLLKRDGSNCFYCGLPLAEDITLEHIIPLSSGGPNRIGNMVLSHDECNNEAGTRTVFAKLNLAIEKRKQSLKTENK